MSNANLEQFTLALAVGMNTAAHVVAERWGPKFAQCIYDYRQEWELGVNKKANGRKMVYHDIYLRIPLMVAADLYGQSPPPIQSVDQNQGEGL